MRSRTVAGRHLGLVDVMPLQRLRNEAGVNHLLHEIGQIVRRFRTAALWHTHRLTDHHEALVEQVQAAGFRGVAFELLLYARRDAQMLVEKSDAHRTGTENVVVQRLGRSRRGLTDRRRMDA